MDSLASTTIPTALNELAGNKDRIIQIAQYCQGAYKDNERDTVFQQTKDYTTNALQNVALHIHTIAEHVQNFFTLTNRRIRKNGYTSESSKDKTDLQPRSGRIRGDEPASHPKGHQTRPTSSQTGRQ